MFRLKRKKVYTKVGEWDETWMSTEAKRGAVFAFLLGQMRSGLASIQQNSNNLI